MTKRFSSPPRANSNRRIFTAAAGCLALLAVSCARTVGSGYNSDDCVSYESIILLEEGQSVRIAVDDISFRVREFNDYLTAKNINGELSLDTKNDSGKIEYSIKDGSISGDSGSLHVGDSKITYQEDDQTVTISNQHSSNGSLSLHIEQACKSE